MDDIAKMWDWLEDVIGVSEQTLSVVTDINGYTMETLNDILYSVTGYRSRQQYEEA